MTTTITPYDWQKIKIKKLIKIFEEYPAAIDASDTGTGKTITAIGMLREMHKKALIVCPKKVHSSWYNVAKAMGAEDTILDVINVEKLRFKNNWYVDEQWQISADDMLIVDEVHKGCSGPKTQTTKRVARAKAQNLKTLCMSATIADSPLKMRAIGYLTGLHRFNDASFYGWCRTNGCYTTPYIPGLQFPKGKTGKDHMLKIHEMLKPMMVRTRLEDIEDFPDCITQANLYDIDAKATKLLVQAYKDLAAQKKVTNKLTELLRARQAAELIKVPLFAELAIDAMEEGKSPVFFVSFRETLFKTQEVLQGLGYRVGRVVGAEDSDADIAAFQADELDALVCMIQAGGVGISLHALGNARPRVSFISPSYNAVEVVQAFGRIRRLGGSKVVQTFVLVAGTIEEQVHKAVVGKLNNIKSLNDGDLEVL